MSRDKQSLEEIKNYDDSYWLRYLAENTIFDTENIKAQKDWLINQLEAEKERADKAEAELSQLQSDFNYITTVKDSHKKRLEEWGNRALESEAREQKLKEAIETAINEKAAWGDAGNALDAVTRYLADTLSSLYTKEETK